VHVLSRSAVRVNGPKGGIPNIGRDREGLKELAQKLRGICRMLFAGNGGVKVYRSGGDDLTGDFRIPARFLHTFNKGLEAVARASREPRLLVESGAPVDNAYPAGW
jgi:hypothetical protein